MSPKLNETAKVLKEKHKKLWINREDKTEREHTHTDKERVLFFPQSTTMGEREGTVGGW